MTLTLTSPQVSNVGAIPVASVSVTVPHEGETNAVNTTPVIIPIIPVTNLEPADLDAIAINILGEVSGAVGSTTNTLPLPEIFTPFGE